MDANTERLLSAKLINYFTTQPKILSDNWPELFHVVLTLYKELSLTCSTSSIQQEQIIKTCVSVLQDSLPMLNITPEAKTIVTNVLQTSSACLLSIMLIDNSDEKKVQIPIFSDLKFDQPLANELLNYLSLKVNFNTLDEKNWYQLIQHSILFLDGQTPRLIDQDKLNLILLTLPKILERADICDNNKITQQIIQGYYNIFTGSNIKPIVKSSGCCIIC